MNRPRVDVSRIAVEVIGSGRPIVFVHGWPMDRRDERDEYEPIFSTRPGWRRIYFDLPGMGASPVQRAIGNLDHMLDAVVAVIDAQVGPGRFCVAGSSAGAYLIRGLLHRLGSRVDGVLLRVPMVVPDSASRDVDPFRVLVEAGPREAARWKRRDPVLVQHERYATALRRKMDERVFPAQNAADLVYLSMIRGDPEAYRFGFDVDAPVALTDAPALIVTGRQDVDVGHRDQWRILMPQFPRATFVALDRTEHAMPMDQMGLWRAMVVDWLDRVDEYVATR